MQEIHEQIEREEAYLAMLRDSDPRGRADAVKSAEDIEAETAEAEARLDALRNKAQGTG